MNLPAVSGGPMERVSGLRFTVVGAGRSGRALGRFLLERGARVVLTDRAAQGLDPEVEGLGRRGAHLALGGHNESDFTGADRVLVSPGVPLDLAPLAAARRAGKRKRCRVEIPIGCLGLTPRSPSPA